MRHQGRLSANLLRQPSLTLRSKGTISGDMLARLLRDD